MKDSLIVSVSLLQCTLHFTITLISFFCTKMSDEYNIEVVKCLDLTTLDHFRESVIEFCEKNQEFGDALKGYEIYKKKNATACKKSE